MVLPDRRLFPFRVGLGQAKHGIRDLKASEARVKAPQTFACTEGTFPTASPLLSTNVLLSHLKYTVGQFPQEETEENMDVWTWG